MSLKHINASNGSGEAVVANVTALRLSGAAVITVDSITDFPEYFIATTGKLLTDQTIDPTTSFVFFGHTSSGTVVIDTPAPGYTDHGNAVNDIVVIKPTTAWADQIAATLGVSLADDGTISSAGLTQITSGLNGQSVRLKPRISVTTSTATLTPNIDSFNVYELNALSGALTIANPSGTPNDGDVLVIRIKDNGSAQSIAYGTAFLNESGLPWLTATVAGKWHYIGAMYVASATKWHIISFTTGA